MQLNQNLKNMKRIFLIRCVVLCGTFFCSAQERSTDPDDTLRYLSSTMTQNWFVSVNGNVNWWQASDRNPVGHYNTILSGPTFGCGLAFGKWITHNIALRLSYDINRAHSYIDGRHVNSSNLQFLFRYDPEPDVNGFYQTSFMYHNLHADVLISPVDLVLGYYDNRFYTPVIAVGMGLACISEHFFVTQTFIESGFKKNRNFEPTANIGLINCFRMNKQFEFTLTPMVTASRFSIDSWGYEYEIVSDDQTIRPRAVDFDYSIALGITWNLSGNDKTGSRIYELPYNYSKEMKEMRTRIRGLEDELDECLHNRPTDTSVKIIGSVDTVQEIVSFPLSVFFERDSYQLMSRRDLVNLREIARVATEKGWKIRLRGSCDSATATAEYNQRLSENRCNKIKLEFLDMGIPESQIILVPVGGVHELNPTEYDRRVLIELVKELK